MLKTQYRMHPAIRRFPSSYFYDGKLKDGGRARAMSYAPAGAAAGAPGFLALRGESAVRLAPYAFFNLRDGQQTRGDGGRSLRNDVEARFLVRLLLALVHAADAWHIEVVAGDEAREIEISADERDADERDVLPTYGSVGGTCGAADADGCCPFGSVCGRVVMLTPYREQKRALEAELSRVFGPGVWEHAVEVASVDAYQGKEKEVVLYSCVRSGTAGLGFVKDLRRLNVALTRAKHALYVIGNDASLRQSETWAALLDDAHNRGLSVDVSGEQAMRASPRELLRKVPVTTLDGTPPAGSPRGAPPQRSVPLVR